MSVDDWMTVGSLRHALSRLPDDMFVLLEVGGDGAVHGDILRHVRRGYPPLNLSRHGKSVTLSGEHMFTGMEGDEI